LCGREEPKKKRKVGEKKGSSAIIEGTMKIGRAGRERDVSSRVLEGSQNRHRAFAGEKKGRKTKGGGGRKRKGEARKELSSDVRQGARFTLI